MAKKKYKKLTYTVGGSFDQRFVDLMEAAREQLKVTTDLLAGFKDPNTETLTAPISLWDKATGERVG